MKSSKKQALRSYTKIVDQLYQQVEGSEEYERDKSNVLSAKISEVVLPSLSKINGGLKIGFDRNLGRAMEEKVNEVLIGFRTNKNFSYYKKRLHFLKALANTLQQRECILKKDYTQIVMAIRKIQHQPEYRLQQGFNLLQDSSDVYEFRSDFFDFVGIKVDDCEEEQIVFQAYKCFYQEALKTYDRKLLGKIDYLIGKYQDRQQILPSGLLEKIDEVLKNDIGRDDEEIQINQQLRRMAAEECLDSNLEHKQKMEEYFEYLKGIFNKFSGLKVFSQELKVKFHLAKFGSNVSGFASKNTDMDLTVLTDCYIEEKSLLRIINKFLEAELREKYKENGRNIYRLEFLESARIPLIKLHFMKNREIVFHFDIIVNNILGVINSKFLAVYGRIPWIRDLGILIKMWGKNKDLISEWKFSSYSFNMMFISFLIETRRINLVMDARSRQEITPHFVYKRMIKNQAESFNVYYQFRTDPSDVTQRKRVSYYQILTEFFDYYKKDGDHWKLPKEERIITLDGSKKKVYDPEYIFTMKDPFDETHNPGRVKISEMNNVMQKFNNASQSMKERTWESVRDLLEGKIIC